ncbi:MAG: hypothetical protein V4500_11885 [Pseudomonadota bacterium]
MLTTVDAGVMAGTADAWAKETSACSSESSADESTGVAGTSSLSDDSGVSSVIRGIVAGSASGTALSTSCSSFAKLVDFFSVRDVSVAAKDRGIPAVMPVSVAESELRHGVLARLGVCIEGVTTGGVIGSSGIFSLRP